MSILAISLVLALFLIAISYSDFLTFEIPDILNLGLVVSGLFVAWLLMPDQLWFHALAAIAWGLFFWSLSAAFLKYRGYNGLGLGDAKLAAGIGAWLGIFPVISVILLGSISAILFLFVMARIQKTKAETLPIAFGPFLCLSTWWVWLFGPVTVW